MKHLIAISAHHGEDADKFVNIFLREHKLCKKYSFGDLPRMYASIPTGISPDLFKNEQVLKTYLDKKWGYTREERFDNKGDIEIRPVNYYKTAQQVLTSMYYLGREIHSNFWVYGLMNTIREDIDGIIDDLTYPNEAEALRERGAIMVRLKRSSSKSFKKFNPSSFLETYPSFTDFFTTDGKDENIEEAVKKLISKYAI